MEEVGEVGEVKAGAEVREGVKGGEAVGGERVKGDGGELEIEVTRVTLRIPDSLDARLRHEAARRGITISELTREALAAYLSAESGLRKLGAAKAGRSGHADVSERIEEILATRARQ